MHDDETLQFYKGEQSQGCAASEVRGKLLLVTIESRPASEVKCSHCLNSAQLCCSGQEWME